MVPEKADWNSEESVRAVVLKIRLSWMDEDVETNRGNFRNEF